MTRNDSTVDRPHLLHAVSPRRQVGIDVARLDLATHLRHQFSTYGTTRTFTFLREQGRHLVPEVTTFADLDRDARAVAAWLAGRPESTRPVVLLYDTGTEFWRAFLGCLYAGVVAVPAPLPHDEKSIGRLAGIVRDSGAALVLTSADLRDVISAGLATLDDGAQLDCVATDATTLADPQWWTKPQLTADSPAFLQYTSGSTGDPKGVVVTHGSIMHNVATIASAMSLDDSSSLVGWVPHFHDMGLISQLSCFSLGGRLAIMSPLSFIKQPIRFLQALHDHRATVTAAPNFAYDLIARRVSPEQVAGLDLSSLSVAMNGAEPVRRHSIDAFTELLAPAGLPASAVRPCYGMAEVTLFASGSREAYLGLDADADQLEQGHLVPARDGRSVGLVSSGPAGHGIDLLIVDPDSREPLPHNRIGEIWLRGASVTDGYYRRAQDTADAFAATTADGDGPYLRTGDLGALHRGHLFVTGRRKDLVIINGRNLYPQDIEDLARQCHPAVDGARGVAVSVDTGDGERLVVIQSVRPERLGDTSLDQLARTVAVTIARTLEIPAPTVILVGRSGIALTTSGKVQRAAMRAAFLRNELADVLHENLDPTLNSVRSTPSHPAKER